MGPLTGQHLRCPKCQKEFVPKGADKPIIRTGSGPEAKLGPVAREHRAL